MGGGLRFDGHWRVAPAAPTQHKHTPLPVAHQGDAGNEAIGGFVELDSTVIVGRWVCISSQDNHGVRRNGRRNFLSKIRPLQVYNKPVGKPERFRQTREQNNAEQQPA